MRKSDLPKKQAKKMYFLLFIQTISSLISLGFLTFCADQFRMIVVGVTVLVFLFVLACSFLLPPVCRSFKKQKHQARVAQKKKNQRKSPFCSKSQITFFWFFWFFAGGSKSRTSGCSSYFCYDFLGFWGLWIQYIFFLKVIIFEKRDFNLISLLFLLFLSWPFLHCLLHSQSPFLWRVSVSPFWQYSYSSW